MLELPDAMATCSPTRSCPQALHCARLRLSRDGEIDASIGLLRRKACDLFVDRRGLALLSMNAPFPKVS